MSRSSHTLASPDGSARSRRALTQTILGIDPGSRFTGFGVLRVDGDRIIHVSHGVIAPPASLPFCERIGVIGGEIEALLERVSPQVTVIEKVFLGKNADSAFKLGHARGVAMASAVRAGSEIVEYATRSVKKGITGQGGATKEQVQAVVFALLGLKNSKNASAQLDASDALALAFYHARNLEVHNQLARQSREQSERLSRTGEGRGPKLTEGR